jgi:uncharacterized protein YndB with AHSA1/START domain
LISAERRIAQPPEVVFEFLADLRNHWKLEERSFVEVEELDGGGGVIRLRIPPGLSRRVETRLLETERPRLVSGRADLRGGTVGLVTWRIEPAGDGSRVQLEAEVAQASRPDRALLALGGRAWLGGLFRRTLGNLEDALQR